MSVRTRWAISVVSHGHGASVAKVLGDAHGHLGSVPHLLTLTLNDGEDTAFVASLPASLQQNLRIIRNPEPRGFGANHNAALRGVDADHVLIADPDLALPAPIFGALEQALDRPGCGIVAPLAQSPDGHPEDNGRNLPTPAALLGRRLGGRRRDRLRYASTGAQQVDWVAGLFMAMRAETFERLRGFDERYFMYCEDVDLCLRARALGLQVLLLSDLRIVHAARRRTLRDPRHLAWHLASLLQLWRSPAFRAAGSHSLDTEHDTR